MTLIKCSFCEQEYDADKAHTCAGNSVALPYRRHPRGLGLTGEAPRFMPAEPEGAHTYARDLLQAELKKLHEEREAIDADYEAYRLVHEPMILSLATALAKL
jgi:hypothetical protein